MGIGPGYRHRSTPRTEYVYVDRPAKSTTPNPDPKNFRIRRIETFTNAVVLLVQYPDCTNFEGKKVMVYRGTTVNDILSTDELDPHFTESTLAPVARFEPTDEGWRFACQFARTL